MIRVTDQMNYALELEKFPGRIVSLVPSQTELLFDLGLGDKVVGITKFCVHPEEWFRSKTRVGGTKTVNIEKIRSLNPDLIIGNKEENVKGQILELKKEFSVWMSDIRSLTDALVMIREVGRITDKLKEAEVIISKISSGFRDLTFNKNASKKRAAYFIWKDPYMVCGKDTFTGELLALCGFVNVFEGRYPEVSVEELKSKNPEVIFLSSEPYPFKEKHIAELKLILPETEILLVDGEMWSWYGSRLRESAEYLKTCITEFL